jgi:shikimate kinase
VVSLGFFAVFLSPVRSVFNGQLLIDNLPNSLSVYLKASVETLTARLKDSIEERPLISHLQDPLELNEFITKHLFERSFYYEKSKFKLKTDGLDINTIVKLIVKLST